MQLDKTITVRKAQLADVSSIAKVHFESYLQANVNFLIQEALSNFTLKQIYENWTKRLMDQEFAVFVAESDCQIVGLIGFIYPNNHNLKSLEIRYLYILPRYQRKVIGSYLCLQAAIGLCPKLPVKVTRCSQLLKC